MTQRDPFKFALQEEKFNTIKQLSNLNTNTLINNIWSKTNFENKENKSIINEDKLNHTIFLNKQTINRNLTNLNIDKDNDASFNYVDQNNEYLHSFIGKFRLEISLLKGYITRLNNEIRKRTNIEIPLLQENFRLNNNTDEKGINTNFEELIQFFNESVERLINPDYLNPIFSLYDSHILNIENELSHYKTLCSKYENKISELTKENNLLRDDSLVKTNEIRDLLRLKVDSPTSIVPLDEEFIKTLEERNTLLSKENEILAINYQKISKDLFEFSMIYSEKHKENLEKIQLYDKLNEELTKVSASFDNAVLKNQINENKIIELSELVTRLEIEKDTFRIECERYRTEIHSLNEANQFYKNYISKINNN